MYAIPLSIIIINRHDKSLLEHCLYSIKTATRSIEAEVIVICNHLTEHSANKIQEIYPECLINEEKDNTKFYSAINKAINTAKGENILFVHADTIIGESTLRSVLLFMDEHNDAGAVGLKNINGHGQFLPESMRSFPTPWFLFCKLFGLSKMFPKSKLFAKNTVPFLKTNKTKTVEILSDNFMLIKHEVLKQTEGFDEALFMYGADMELCLRIQQEGFNNYYIPELVLNYYGTQEKFKYKIDFFNAFYQAMLIIYKKHPQKNGILISQIIRLSLAFKKIQYKLSGNSVLKSSKNEVSRTLIICHKERLEEVKNKYLENMGEKKTILSLWDLNILRPMDAISRKNLMIGYTDIVFCHPELGLERIFLFMDKMPNKNINYCIYNTDLKQLIPYETSMT